MTQASGLMWHDVPNRGGRITITPDLRNSHDVGLSSGWQGDNAGGTAVPANASTLTPVTPTTNEWVKTPVLTGVTGRILGRIVNRSGTNQPLNVMGNPIPYFPANSADNTDAVLKVHTHETLTGVVTEGDTIPNSDWKFCYGAGATFASAGTTTPSLPVRLCLNGAVRSFDPAKLYQLVYTVKDPYVLGAGTAAFRDVESFFRYETADSHGTANPLLAQVPGKIKIKWAIIRGSSQSGNFTRHFIFLGMNQDEANRIVHEGAWPLIAGRRVANNSRWGQPVGVRERVMHGPLPPDSVWPRMRGPKNDRTLVEPTRAAMGFPRGVPGIPDSIFAPETFVNPVLDYDWGPDFDEFNATGTPTNEPPPIKNVIKMLVPKVDSDGNELGGVPTVLRDAPLGTYLGWNITAGPGDPNYDGRPFHAGQTCNYVGGMVPFAKKTSDKAADDLRPSLEERYGTHAKYVAAVKAAADNAACQGYLLAGPDAKAMGAKCTTSIP